LCLDPSKSPCSHTVYIFLLGPIYSILLTYVLHYVEVKVTWNNYFNNIEHPNRYNSKLTWTVSISQKIINFLKWALGIVLGRCFNLSLKLGYFKKYFLLIAHLYRFQASLMRANIAFFPSAGIMYFSCKNKITITNNVGDVFEVSMKSKFYFAHTLTKSHMASFSFFENPLNVV
jgi:hypothetical protein